MNKVLIATPTPGYAKFDSFYDYHMLIDKPEGAAVTFARGQSPARNRNMMIAQAIEHDFTHVLFLDDDTAPPKDIITKLLAHDLDMVTGLYFMRSYPHQPIIFDWNDDKGGAVWHLLSEGETGLIPVYTAGLGAALIKTSVFKTMKELGYTFQTPMGAAWITLGELEPDHWCDDIAFFKRANKAGFKLFCDLTCISGHAATAVVYPRYVDGKWFITYDTRGTQSVTFPCPGPSVDKETNDSLLEMEKEMV